MRKRGLKFVREKFLPTSIWKRAIAYLIDSFIISFAIAGPFQSLLQIKADSFADIFNIRPVLTAKFFFILLIIAVLLMIYWSLLEFKFGQSLGKMVMKIHVRSTKKKLSLKQCFNRNVSKISTLLLILDCIYILVTRKHQRYLEKITNTEVVEAVYGI